MNVYCDPWMWQIDGYLVMASTVNYTSVLAEIQPRATACSTFVLIWEVTLPAAFVDYTQIKVNAGPQVLSAVLV